MPGPLARLCGSDKVLRVVRRGMDESRICKEGENGVVPDMQRCAVEEPGHGFARGAKEIARRDGGLDGSVPALHNIIC